MRESPEPGPPTQLPAVRLPAKQVNAFTLQVHRPGRRPRCPKLRHTASEEDMTADYSKNQRLMC
jgi:hypothetical protein